MGRIDWTRHKKTGAAYGPVGGDRRLEAKADALLAAGSRAKTSAPPHPIAGIVDLFGPQPLPMVTYSRAIGSVLREGNDRWTALDGVGKAIGHFPTRREAWAAADRLGMEVILVGGEP